MFASNDLGIWVEEVTKTIIYDEDTYIIYCIRGVAKPNTDDLMKHIFDGKLYFLGATTTIHQLKSEMISSQS